MVAELGYTGIKIFAISIEIGIIALSSALLYFYIKSYRKIKIGFTIGLILFALLLLLKGIIIVVFLLLAPYETIIGTPTFPGELVELIELVALAVLLKVTWSY